MNSFGEASSVIKSLITFNSILEIDDPLSKSVEALCQSLERCNSEVDKNLLDILNNDKSYMSRTADGAFEQSGRMSADYDKEARLFCLRSLLRPYLFKAEPSYFCMSTVCIHSKINLLSSSYQSSRFIEKIDSKEKKLLLVDASPYILEYNCDLVFERLIQEVTMRDIKDSIRITSYNAI